MCSLETLRFAAACCVSYREFFASGDVEGGAYQCRVTLADPNGWPWRPGGPSAPPPLSIEEPIAPAELGLCLFYPTPTQMCGLSKVLYKKDLNP
ncbi:hypothetical protein IC235_16370 [Hymenobacter sp. BT664]|uniref:Uncharacterized protein n=1 Tax=Hymenobacter montanus TaxID=2771359 RepID=A0A927GKH1_9BACT|nr:hypothetical protein [Hymenobacter montanus]MBD2769465.1 hypothetical protein [Hymenobacter montanus]